MLFVNEKKSAMQKALMNENSYKWWRVYARYISIARCSLEEEREDNIYLIAGKGKHQNNIQMKKGNVYL